MRLYAANFPYSVDEELLKSLFENYGRVESIIIIKDRRGKSRGFAFIEMPNEDEAMNAILALNETNFDGRILYVSRAKERPQIRRYDD